MIKAARQSHRRPFSVWHVAFSESKTLGNQFHWGVWQFHPVKVARFHHGWWLARRSERPYRNLLFGGLARGTSALGVVDQERRGGCLPT